MISKHRRYQLEGENSITSLMRRVEADGAMQRIKLDSYNRFTHILNIPNATLKIVRQTRTTHVVSDGSYLPDEQIWNKDAPHRRQCQSQQKVYPDILFHEFHTTSPIARGCSIACNDFGIVVEPREIFLRMHIKHRSTLLTTHTRTHRP